jgi:hypothetical protein
MDPSGATDDALLAPLGVRVNKALIANDRYLVRVEGHGESPYDLGTNRSSTHPIVATLEQYASRFWVGLFGVSNISLLEGVSPEVNVSFALHSMPNSWEDKNGNRKFDAATEQRGNYEFVAAVEKEHKKAVPPAANKVSPAGNAPPKAEKPAAAGANESAEADETEDEPTDEPQNADALEAPAANPAATAKVDKSAPAPKSAQTVKTPPTRAVIVSDADFATNGVVRNMGNAYLLSDSLRWLAGDEQNAGIVESEKDVPLVHRKDEDGMWFYGTSFMMPALVLIGGMWATRRATRSRRAR